MISADLFRAAVALTWAGSLAVAYAVAFGLSVGAVPFNPAAGSLLPDVVGDGEVIDANSAMWTAAVSVQIVLAPVAGFVIAALVVEIAFLINAATFKVWALLILTWIHRSSWVSGIGDVHQKGLLSWDDCDVRSHKSSRLGRHFLCGQYRAPSIVMTRLLIMTV